MKARKIQPFYNWVIITILSIDNAVALIQRYKIIYLCCGPANGPNCAWNRHWRLLPYWQNVAYTRRGKRLSFLYWHKYVYKKENKFLSYQVKLFHMPPNHIHVMGIIILPIFQLLYSLSSKLALLLHSLWSSLKMHHNTVASLLIQAHIDKSKLKAQQLILRSDIT